MFEKNPKNKNCPFLYTQKPFLSVFQFIRGFSPTIETGTRKENSYIYLLN